MRRHDTLPRLIQTLAAALLCGLLVEAHGLHIWAERLNIGPLRGIALPLTDTWQQWSQPLRLERLRDAALLAKDDLAPLMLPSATATANAAPASAVPPPAPLPAPALQLATASATAPPAPAVAPPPASRAINNATLPADAAFDVVLAGDSMMAVGLAPTLKRWLTPNKHVRVLTAYRSGTGLARPEVFDWVSAYPQMVGAAKPSLVICAMGGNDAQSVQVGKKILQFDTPEWDDFFRARLRAYLDVVTRTPVRVLWVGMPEMRSAAYSDRMAHLNSLVKTTLAAYPNSSWLDPRAVMDPHGTGFQQFRTSQDGKVVKLREDDGIHLTDDGAVDLLEPIQHWVTANQRRAMAPVSGVATTATRL